MASIDRCENTQAEPSQMHLRNKRGRSGEDRTEYVVTPTQVDNPLWLKHPTFCSLSKQQPMI